MKKKPSQGERLIVQIERLSVGGRGVARSEGLVIFVPDTAPGESAEIELTVVKKNFAEGRLLQVLTASPHRRTPPCPVAGVCGGCNWQHLDYPEQLRAKRDLVRESLTKFSGFDVTKIDLVSLTVPSPKEFRYRNRSQFHFENGRFGYFMRGSHKIVDINDCPITEEPIAKRIPELKREFSSGRGRVEVSLDRDGEVRSKSADRVHASDEEQGGLSFSQVNSGQNLLLIDAVLSDLKREAAAPENVLDLYSGSGNFTFPIAELFPGASITAVELNPASVKAGALSAEREYGGRVQFVSMDVGEYLRQHGVADGSLVLLDPPRTGCTPDVIEILSASRPSILVYVSCHPVTLARDLGVFQKRGFVLESVQPFDMFPQTDHVETVAVLRPG